MTRTVSAIALSLTIFVTSLTATAAPARADEDVAKVLAGLALLGIIAATVKANKEPEPVARGNHRAHRPHVTPRRSERRKVAPRRCLRDQWTHRGVRQVYGAGCLRNTAQAKPPRACLRDARTNSGPRRFYTKRCLRKHGWRA